MQVYLNGDMLAPDAAAVRVDDAGLQHAVGLFETMAAVHGRCFRLTEHLERLDRSAVQLGLSRGLDLPALREAVERTLAHNDVTAARVRLTVTAGPLSLLRPPQEQAAPQPTVLVAVQTPMAYDPAYFDRGITAIIAAPKANPFDLHAGHKTLAYWPRLSTLRQAAEAGAGEAIWLNVTNHLASGAVSNLLLMRDGTLYTPIARGEEVEGALPAPVLPGVTRAAVLELAEQAGIEVVRKMLTVEDLLDADELMLTNSGWQVLPVTRVEGKPIADGKVGQQTQALRDALLKLIDEETRA
jgi:branched-chain amino acid aminotransferase